MKNCPRINASFRITFVRFFQITLATTCLCLATGAQEQWTEQRLKSFGIASEWGAIPSPLLLGADGAFYGTTQLGGNDNVGTIFKVSTDGTGYTVLYSFSNTGTGSN